MRHHNCFGTLIALGILAPENEKPEWFKEGLKIAIAASQIITKSSPTDLLMSEDLY